MSSNPANFFYKYLPMNPGVPADEVSFAWSEIERVILLPLKWQIFRSAKVQNSISNLLKVEGFTTAVLRFSGDFESFRSLFHEKDISVPQNTILSIHHRISRNFKHIVCNHFLTPCHRVSFFLLFLLLLNNSSSSTAGVLKLLPSSWWSSSMMASKYLIV